MTVSPVYAFSMRCTSVPRMCYTIKVGLHVYLDAPSIFFGLITMFNATSGVAVEMKNFSSNVIDKIPTTDVSSTAHATK